MDQFVNFRNIAVRPGDEGQVQVPLQRPLVLHGDRPFADDVQEIPVIVVLELDRPQVRNLPSSIVPDDGLPADGLPDFQISHECPHTPAPLIL